MEEHPPILSSYQHSEEIITSSYRRYSTNEMDVTSNENFSDQQAVVAEESPASQTKCCRCLPPARKWPWGKLLIAAILIGVVTFVIVDSLTNKHISNGFQVFLTWIESNLVAGVFAFMGVYFIATVCFVPGSLLTLGSGFVFGSAVGVGYGVLLASVAVLVGATLGSIVAFLLGRYLLRECVRHRLVKKYPVVEAVDEALQSNGFKIFFLLRLSPIVPFNAINYIAGVTGISLRNYTLALIGIIPGTVLYCFIGATAGGLMEAEQGVSQPVTIASIVVGVVLAFAAVFVASYYAKREFNKIIEEKQNTEREEEDADEEEGLPPSSAEAQVETGFDVNMA